MKILIEVSARHVHLSKNDLKTLFGENHELTFKKALSQPGQFLCEERVVIANNENFIKNVAILGPVREKTQVELSLTDARKLGINAPIRDSGDLKGTAGCKIIGSSGKISLSEGVIVAKRHIHMTPKDAQNLNVCDRQIVKMNINTAERGLIFDNIIVRVDAKYAIAMHIDTDEANAAGIFNQIYGEII
jgi:putative phosphotransacetylase